jgi:hypothetical protein
MKLLNVSVDWVTFLLCALEVPDLNISPETSYLGRVFQAFNILKRPMATFFPSHNFFVRNYITYVVEQVSLNKEFNRKSFYQELGCTANTQNVDYILMVYILIPGVTIINDCNYSRLDVHTICCRVQQIHNILYCNIRTAHE